MLVDRKLMSSSACWEAFRLLSKAFSRQRTTRQSRQQPDGKIYKILQILANCIYSPINLSTQSQSRKAPMASNDGETTKKNKSTNENNYNNKTFSQKNKSRNHSTAEATGNGKAQLQKGKNGQEKNSSSSSSDEGEIRQCSARILLNFCIRFRSLLEVPTAPARFHIRVLCAVSELYGKQCL